MERSDVFRQITWEYLRSRARIFHFLVLSVLLVMLGMHELAFGTMHVRNFFFVFITLFVFRWLDDAASFYIDREEHPSRMYIRTEYFRAFALLTGILLIVYLLLLWIYIPALAPAITALAGVSMIFYLLFYQRKKIMILVPLLKYPVIIWCLGDLSLESGPVMIMVAIFLIMLDMDIFGSGKLTRRIRMIRFFMLAAIGLLILQPWAGPTCIHTRWIFSGLVPLLFLLVPSKRFRYVPVFLFPVIHMIDLFIC